MHYIRLGPQGPKSGLGVQIWLGMTKKCVQFRVQAKSKNLRINPKLNPMNPLLGGGSGPQGPNLGSIRVRLALRLRNSSDFSVPSFTGHIQSTKFAEKGTSISKTTMYVVIDSM